MPRSLRRCRSLAGPRRRLAARLRVGRRAWRATRWPLHVLLARCVCVECARGEQATEDLRGCGEAEAPASATAVKRHRVQDLTGGAGAQDVSINVATSYCVTHGVVDDHGSVLCW